MGLFDLFKKNKPSHDEKTNAAYKCYKPDMVKMVFPGGQKQASGIISSLARICSIDLDSCDAKKYYDILSMYSDVLIRKVVTQSTDSHIVSSLLVKHGDVVSNKSISQKVLAYVTLNMANNNFMVSGNEDLAILDMLAGQYQEAEKNAAANSVAQEQNLDDPEYGLVAGKPVYVQGIAGSKAYLNKLKSSLGENLSWNRRGSTSVAGINGMIDVYDSQLPSGKPYKTVYINMYGASNSTKTPKGFSK